MWWLEDDTWPPRSPGSGWHCLRISQTANQAGQLLKSYGIIYTRVHKSWLLSVKWMNKMSRWKCGDSLPATECEKQLCWLLGSLEKILKTHTVWDALRLSIGWSFSSLCPIVLWEYIQLGPKRLETPGVIYLHLNKHGHPGQNPVYFLPGYSAQLLFLYWDFLWWI